MLDLDQAELSLRVSLELQNSESVDEEKSPPWPPSVQEVGGKMSGIPVLGELSL